MILTNTNGLWALLFLIPVIALFLFKSKFIEHTVSTNYLWNLSKKSSRNLNINNQWMKWILLALQCLMVISLSLVLSGARLIADTSGIEYVLVLDTSASMALENQDGESSFERACVQIETLAQEMPNGSKVTLILTGEESRTLVSRSESAREIKDALKTVQCEWTADSYESAFSSAQEVLRMYPNAKVCFYTDHAFENVENVDVIDVFDTTTWNISAESLKTKVSSTGISFTAQIKCTNQEGTFPVALYVDDVLVSAQMVTFADGQEQTVTFFQKGLLSFDTARIYIDAQDGMQTDNEFCCAGTAENVGSILLVSSEPYYWQQGLEAFNKYKIDWDDPNSYQEKTGYDIYIFDGFTPDNLPTDGVIWLANPSAVPDETGIVLGEAIRGTYLSTVQSIKDERMAKLTQSFTADKIAVLQLTKAVETGNFTSVLMCGNLPAMLVGEDAQGIPMLIFLFDLHHSNLPMTTDYISLLHNMLEYSIPSILETDSIAVGQSVQLVRMPFLQEVKLIFPNAQEETVNEDTIKITEPGLYLLQAQGKKKQYEEKLYAYVDNQELLKAGKMDEEAVLLLSRPSENDAAMKMAQNSESDSIDMTGILALFFLLCLTIECVVYHHEQV